MIKNRVAAMACCLILSSCLTPTGTQRPVDVVTYGAKAGAGSTGIHTILPGDTVYVVSKRYNLPLRDIITVNNLSAPYRLPLGYRLILPPPNEYQVKAGDTLNGVSRLFNVSVSEVARLNKLSEPFVLSRGQVLRLPSSQPKLQEEFAVNTPQPTFEAGETTSVPLKVGAVESEVLAPPGVTPQSVTPSAGFPPAPSATAPTPQIQTVSVPPTSRMTTDAPLPARTGRFMRPLDGKVISSYGPKPDGLHNDGINIRAPRGTPVRAAENGVIAYTGSGMSGYGNLVLIRHADRYMTAYAHMEKILVKKGDVVKAGQSIGTVGSTGQVDSSQLHFEVRKGTQPVDPAKFI